MENLRIVADLVSFLLQSIGLSLFWGRGEPNDDCIRLTWMLRTKSTLEPDFTSTMLNNQLENES